MTTLGIPYQPALPNGGAACSFCGTEFPPGERKDFESHAHSLDHLRHLRDEHGVDVGEIPDEPEPQYRTDGPNGHLIARLLQQATPPVPSTNVSADLWADVLTIAADLLDLHDRRGISLDKWPAARSFIERLTSETLTENGA